MVRYFVIPSIQKIDIPRILNLFEDAAFSIATNWRINRSIFRTSFEILHSFTIYHVSIYVNVHNNIIIGYEEGKKESDVILIFLELYSKELFLSDGSELQNFISEQNRLLWINQILLHKLNGENNES